MMPEATKIAGLGQDGQGEDRSDTWQLAEPQVIGMPPKDLLGLSLDLVPLADEAASLCRPQQRCGRSEGHARLRISAHGEKAAWCNAAALGSLPRQSGDDGGGAEI